MPPQSLVMPFSRKLRACVSFARWCRENRLGEWDAAMLLVLARRAFKAGERECNTGRSADRQRNRFEEHARLLGFKTKWPGLLPMLTKRGRDIYLPEV